MFPNHRLQLQCREASSISQLLEGPYHRRREGLWPSLARCLIACASRKDLETHFGSRSLGRFAEKTSVTAVEDNQNIGISAFQRPLDREPINRVLFALSQISTRLCKLMCLSQSS